jgi:glucokinase
MTTTPPLLGIEIGGTKLQLALGRGDGTLLALARHAVDPARGAEALRGQLVASARDLIERAGQRPAAVGVGFGGPVDPSRGVVNRSHQVSGWEDFPLAAWLREALGIGLVVVHNDSDSAALAEARFGAGAGLSPVLYVNSGSGVGGGLVIDGEIYRGQGSGAVEIGHLWIRQYAPEDSNPEAATLEEIASGWAIARAARRHVEAFLDRQWEAGRGIAKLSGGQIDRVTTRLVAEAASQGDYLARSILDRASSAMAQALAHAVTLLAPRRVILGGGVSLMDEALWLDPIRRELDGLVFPPLRGTFDVGPAALGEEVVVHGALALARDAWAMLASG